MDTGSSCSLNEKNVESMGVVAPPAVPKRKYKKRLPSAPMEMKTRGVKLPRYSHNMKQVNSTPVMAVKRSAKTNQVVTLGDDRLQLESNPLKWTVEEVVGFLGKTDCADLKGIFKEQVSKLLSNFYNIHKWQFMSEIFSFAGD